MLNSDTIKKIEDFVYSKPRSIQEIAEKIKKNWRTADRYVEEIEKNFGTLSTRTFRAGTRGALKIVYWSAVEKVSNTIFQEELEKEIVKGKTKYDFSGFNIFQFVKEKEKSAWIKKGENEVKSGRLCEFEEILNQAKEQIIFLSGNLSFINFKDKKTEIFSVLDKLVKKGIRIKVLCRVDIESQNNVEKLLSLNHKYGKEKIEVRHREQPLRATIIDKKMINLKEVKEPSNRTNESNEKIFIFYNIKEKAWIEWLTKIFWKMFNSSISAQKRIEEIKRIF